MPGEWAAPGPLHRPVNRLHSIELQADTGGDFLLTPSMRGVITESFFDSF